LAFLRAIIARRWSRFFHDFASGRKNSGFIAVWEKLYAPVLLLGVSAVTNRRLNLIKAE
jgi:hypothetical protein